MSNFSIVIGFISIITLLLLTLSIVFIDSGSLGAVFRFGKFRRVLDPGLNFIIPILERVERYSTQTHQHELPDEPENIDRTSDALPEGKKHPFRILHSGLKEASFYREKGPSDQTNIPDQSGSRMKLVKYGDLSEKEREAMKEDSLHAPLTSEVSAVVEWHLIDSEEGSIRNFIQNVSPEEGRTREEEVRKRIEDTVATALQEILGRITLGHAREMMPFLSNLLKERLEALVGERTSPSANTDRSWGVEIGTAYLKSIDPGRTVNKARSEAAASVSRKQDTIRDAEAASEAEILKGKGEAGRIEAMAKVMTDDNARFIAALDVAEQVLPKANTVIVPVGGMDAIASVIALGQNLTKGKGS